MYHFHIWQASPRLSCSDAGQISTRLVISSAPFIPKNNGYYSDVIMSAMASQITFASIVYSTVCSGADQRQHQSSASLAFVREFTGHRWIPRTKGQWRGKCFHLMTSSWKNLSTPTPNMRQQRQETWTHIAHTIKNAFINIFRSTLD